MHVYKLYGWPIGVGGEGGGGGVEECECPRSLVIATILDYRFKQEHCIACCVCLCIAIYHTKIPTCAHR